MKDPNNVLQKAIAKGMPVFVIIAQDKASMASYNMACKLIDVRPEHLKETQEIFKDFVKWQNNNPNRVKKPD